MSSSNLRLLALDGGGVRGLSALMILEQLMEAVNPNAPPKPCDYFDMIGGTSTGGLIAVMLGRLKMSVADCITAYLSLSKRVFRKKRHRVTVKGQVQGRFDAEELARAIKEVVKQQSLEEDALLKDAPEAKCKVFVCATSKETRETVCLTSYRTPRGGNDLLNSVTIWEACRATSAATSFFDPIAVGRFGEQFVDGATGANNPVRELWDQAQLVWGPEPLEGKVKCVVSIGTGVPSLKAFKDDILHISETLTAIATETEQTAERFRRERALLDSTGRYYRFNVVRGLEDIGLEEAVKAKEMAAATRLYISSQEVHKQMRACAGNIAGQEYFGEYRTIFSLEGVPRARQFVDRPVEMAELERVLLPQLGHGQRQKIHILRGLGGIGKTQLAVEFARRHHRRFSSVFWLDGHSEDTLKRSIASCAGKIPQGQIPETSRRCATDGSADMDTVVRDVMAWLARSDNTVWLLIFDNVDREYTVPGGDPDAYDVRRYLSGADHGSVLVTTRLAQLEQLGESQQLSKVSIKQGEAILQSWYENEHDTAKSEQLLSLLDGLPLAIAQAGAYLRKTGVGLTKYLRFYEQQWSELMKSDHRSGTPLIDYANRSVWTTWVISYNTIHEKCEATAKLLLLWSYLDNKDLWYELFATACQASETARMMLSECIGDIANNEFKFHEAMVLLRSYSLVESTRTGSYATHPVVHKWALYYQGKQIATKLYRLAVVTVGFSVPEDTPYFSSALPYRLLPHVQSCNRRTTRSAQQWVYRFDTARENSSERNKDIAFLKALYLMGLLYGNQGKSIEAEQMYKQALRGQEALLGPTDESTLTTVNDLAVLYHDQEELVEAERMYERARRGREATLGPDHNSTLQTINNLGTLYMDQRKLADAQQMFEKALRGKVKSSGPEDISTLNTVKNLGCVYAQQSKRVEAQQMFERALRGFERALCKGRRQYYLPALDALEMLGDIHKEQEDYDEACAKYLKALKGLHGHLDQSSHRYKQLVTKFLCSTDQHIRRQEHIPTPSV